MTNEHVPGTVILQRGSRTELVARALSNRALIWVVILGLLMTTLTMLGGFIDHMSKQQVLAFGLFYDRNGVAWSQGPATLLTAANKEETSIAYEAAIRTFIESWRTVTVDAALQHRYVSRAYMFLNPETPFEEAHTFVSSWYQKHEPVVRAETVMVTPSIVNILPIVGKKDTYEVVWDEHTISRATGDAVERQNKSAPGPVRERCTLQFGLRKYGPKTELETVQINPLGVTLRWLQHAEDQVHE